KEEILPITLETSCFPLISDGNVILISGGLGGVGLSIAMEISNHHRVNFILLGRKSINNFNVGKHTESQLKSINFIKRKGSNILMYDCDISEFFSLRKVIKDIKNQFFHIDGVIHTAGIPPLNFVNKKEISEIKEALSGKVLGASNLFKLLKKEKLKF